MGVAHVNENQGAESTVCFLMAWLEMLEVDGNGLEAAGTNQAAARANAADTN
jgi:hypothetical protein